MAKFYITCMLIMHVIYVACHTHNCVVCIPSQSLGPTHSLLTTSMTVPVGHSHPLSIQIAGQGLLPSSLQVR